MPKLKKFFNYKYDKTKELWKEKIEILTTKENDSVIVL